MKDLDIRPSKLWCPDCGPLDVDIDDPSAPTLDSLCPRCNAQPLKLAPWNCEDLPLLAIPLPMSMNPFRPPSSLYVVAAYTESKETLQTLLNEAHNQPQYYLARNAWLVMIKQQEIPPNAPNTPPVHQQLFRPLSLTAYDGLQGTDYLLPVEGMFFLSRPWDTLVRHDIHLLQQQLWETHVHVKEMIDQASRKVQPVGRAPLVTAKSIPNNLTPFRKP